MDLAAHLASQIYQLHDRTHDDERRSVPHPAELRQELNLTADEAPGRSMATYGL